MLSQYKSAYTEIFPKGAAVSCKRAVSHAGALYGYKKRHPNAKTVFISPCVAKKDEAAHYEGIVDAVLTFDELTRWLKSENIELKQEMDSDDNSKARFFPTTGGILKTMVKDNPSYTYMALDGVQNCIEALRDI